MYSVGLDISNLTFTASCINISFSVIFYGKTFEQTPAGWEDFLMFLKASLADREAVVKIIMENTGVYSERISYFLFERGWDLYVEPPHKIHQAFYEEDKTDPVDSRQIAEYGIRFSDQLHSWQPSNQIVEQLHILLTTREHLSRIKAACKTTLKSLKKKHRTYEEIQHIYEKLAADIQTQIDNVTNDMQSIVKTNPELQRTVDDILTLKNVGIILTMYLLVCTEGFQHVNYPSLAKYIGISPLQYQSGTSVKKKTRSRGAGPSQLRKNLYLAALRMRRLDPTFKKYFDRKVAEGKERRLVINNIENKLLRLICGIIKSGKPYIENYRSVKP